MDFWLFVLCLLLAGLVIRNERASQLIYEELLDLKKQVEEDRYAIWETREAQKFKMKNDYEAWIWEDGK